jgi:hypothetical protein
VLGQGKQDNESAVEQAKDEQISGTGDPDWFPPNHAYACLCQPRLLTLQCVSIDFIRGQFKTTTGKDLPIADK